MSRHAVLFVPSLSHGGAEQVAILLANSLSHQGIEVTLVTATADDELSNNLSNQVTQVSLDSSRVLKSIPHFALYLRTTRPDVVLSFMTHANVAAILANKIAGNPTRVVVSEHQTISSREQGFKERVVVRMASWLYSRAYRVIAVSDGLATELRNEFGLDTELVQSIPNPIYRPTEEEIESVPHEWFEGSDPVVVGAGRHEPVKDFSTLIRAVRILRDEGIDVKLIILGKGSKTSELQQLAVDLDIESAVLFPGFVEDPYPYYCAADLFVLSSRWEGFGNVLVEAMTVGTPVVATDCPVGPSEILADGEFGELAPVGDPDGLAHAIHNELQNPTETTKLRERSKEFDPDRIAAMYKRELF